MDEKSRAGDVSSPKHCEKIGFFVVRFEQVGNIMCTCVLNLLEQYGLKNERLGLAVTAELSAYSVLDALRTTIAIHLEDDPDSHLYKVSGQLFKETQELLERRNQLLHSFWLDREPSHDAANLGYRFTNTRAGVALRWLPTLAELDTDIEKASRIFNMLCALNGIVRGVAAPELPQAFTFGADKKLRFDVEFAKSIGFRDLID